MLEKKMDDFVVKHMENISSLFIEAKHEDEFEFCCTILRIRGMEDPGWDSFIEGYNNLIKMIESISKEKDFKRKMGLLLQTYCQSTEIDDIYNILLNLIRVRSGKRHSINPFDNSLYSTRINTGYPAGKIKRIVEQSDSLYNSELSEALGFSYIREVRNAFIHSDYTIYEGNFRIISGKGVNINQVITPEIPLDWLVPRINLAINFALSIYNNVIDHIQLYKKDKVVRGRMGYNESYVDIQLIANQNGLRGFKMPVDETLKST